MNRWLVFALLALCVCGKQFLPHKRHGSFRHELRAKDDEPEPEIMGWFSTAELPCSYMVEGTETYTETVHIDEREDTTETHSCFVSSAFDSDDVVVHKSKCTDDFLFVYGVRGDLANEDGEAPFFLFQDVLNPDDPELCTTVDSVTEEEVPYAVNQARGGYTFDFPYYALRTEEVDGEEIRWFTIYIGEGGREELGIDKDGLLRYDHNQWDTEESTGEDSYAYTYKFDLDKDSFKYEEGELPCVPEGNQAFLPLQREELCKSVQIPEVDCAVKFSVTGFGASFKGYAMPSGFPNFPPILRMVAPGMSMCIRPDLYFIDDDDAEYLPVVTTKMQEGQEKCSAEFALFDNLDGICSPHSFYYPFVRRYFEYEGEPQTDTCEEGACKKYCREEGAFCLTLLDAEPHYAVKYSLLEGPPTRGDEEPVEPTLFSFGVPTPLEDDETGIFALDATANPGCEGVPGVYEAPQFFSMCSKEPSSGSSETSGDKSSDNSGDKSSDNSGDKSSDNSGDKSSDNSGATGSSESKPENKEESVEASSQVTVHVAVVVAAIAVALLSIF